MMMKTLRFIFFGICIVGGGLAPLSSHAAPGVQATGTGLVAKVAPGELLPLSVKLLNFGTSNRVDVVIAYTIVAPDGAIIYSAQETVAVETTATFVKTIPIPFGTIPGRYTARSSIFYPDQVAPAISEFPFTVERKIFGLFQSDFYLYGGIMLAVSVLVGVVSRTWIQRNRKMRLQLMDYSNVPRDKRIFYEMVSDTIRQMRERVGDEALVIAGHVEGLTIHRETGRVLDLSDHPSKIIAELVSEYEKLLGKKVSFSLRKSENVL